MLTCWKISNFKSIRELVTLELAPLTVFSGINSAGKSSVIQSILMVAQSFQTTVESEALVLRGPLVNLGNPIDILHAGYDDQPIDIGFELTNKQGNAVNVKFDCHLSKQLLERSSSKRLDKYHLKVKWTKISFNHEQENKTYFLQITELPNTKLAEDPSKLDPIVSSAIKSGLYDYKLVEPDQSLFVQNAKLERVERVGLKHIVPWQLLIGIDIELKQLIEDVEWLVSEMTQFRPRLKIPDEIREDAKWLKNIMQQKQKYDPKLSSLFLLD